jgi:hypothetical protein
MEEYPDSEQLISSNNQRCWTHASRLSLKAEIPSLQSASEKLL